LEDLRNSYISSLMSYIELEYDNIPDEVTEEMEYYFEECWLETPPLCLPNAAGAFHERFMKGPDNP
jgi:hypothetical protein